ncbi:MAG: helix-turn-helix transcriptional regulator [Alphaproteobacteria bacterium]|nr:helix-turn-helix transcriptional regulator [Alphaproteobacteria bacterium]
MFDIDSTIRGLYDAAVGELPWEEALDRLAGAIDARIVAMTSFDTQTSAVHHRIFRNLDPVLVEEYVTAYRELDPRFHVMRASPGAVIHDGLHQTDAMMDRDPFYAWYERTSGMRYYIGGSTRPGGRLSASLSLHRPRARGPVAEVEIARFTLLFEHFKRAAQISHRLALSGPNGGETHLVTEGSPIGAVFLAADGATLHFNEAAAEIAAAGDGIEISARGIVATRRGDDAALQAHVARACAGFSPADAAPPGGAMRIARSSGRPDYLLLVVPIPRRASFFGSASPAVAIYISDPATVASLREERLRELYALTPAELRLATRLTAGDTLERIAADLQLAMPTLRTQLAAVFRKTNTSRQTDLVRLLMAAPWQLGPR